MRYIVLDLETANADQASICQIGFVIIQDGRILSQTSQYIDPDDYFDPFNVSIHGIDEKKVAGQPRFEQYFDKLNNIIDGNIVVTHGPFDRNAIKRASERHNLTIPNTTWLDNQRVVRRTWPEFSQGGYALKNLTNHFGIPFRHHDALEDAIATATIFQLAMSHSGMNVEEWLIRSAQPITLESVSSITRDGDSAGPFYGQTIVFTGALNIPRRTAADEAARLGFHVAANVTKETNVICVGTQRKEKLSGYEKSAKHRKAESLFKEGTPISIIGEDDFLRLIGMID